MLTDVFFNIAKRNLEKYTRYRLSKVNKNSLYCDRVIDLGIAKELILATELENFSFLIPVEKIVWGYGIKYNNLHPFVRFFEKEDSLDRFYRIYTPKCLHNAFFLNCETKNYLNANKNNIFVNLNLDSCMFGYPNETIWFPYNKKKNYKTEYDQSKGPLAFQYIQESKNRLLTLQKSILKNGYIPESFLGDLTGYFIFNEDFSDFRFFNTGGSHRIATLVALGYKQLAFQFSYGNPRFISTQNASGLEASTLFELLFNEEFISKQQSLLESVYK